MLDNKEENLSIISWVYEFLKIKKIKDGRFYHNSWLVEKKIH